MKLIAKTPYGLEDILAAEIKALGASDITVLNRAVAFSGDSRLLYKANYLLRTALSVLLIIDEFRIRSAKDLYSSSLKIQWDRYLDHSMTFSVVPVVNSPFFKHSGYPGLVLKDAVADWFRRKSGIRPSVDTVDPDTVFNLHISNDMVTISLDSSVIPLYKRGYRKEAGAAPLNEVLAAGIIAFTGWNGSSILVDPMCGSGTIPIEAAMSALAIPPGRYRNFFGFQRWKDYNEELFEEIRKESNSKTLVHQIRVSGSDISEKAVSQAKTNVRSAGLSEIISVQRQNLKDVKAVDNTGVIVMNPPYGKRIKVSETDDLYQMIGTSLKHNFPGYKAWILTSDKESLKHVGLKPSRKIVLYNGSLECLLVSYDLYHGSKKNNPVS